MTSIEKSGRTVEEAIEAALLELGVERADVEVEVLDEGSKGFLGMFGAKQAQVRVTYQQSIHSRIEKARQFLIELLDKMDVEANVDVERAEEGLVHMRISGRRMGVVIGRRGQTLDSIQYLVNLVANREPGTRARIVLDAEGYREKRAETLTQLAKRLAEKAKSQRRKAALEPMSALERRVVHMALADDKDVETHSEGNEPYRRVVIVPKR